MLIMSFTVLLVKVCFYSTTSIICPFLLPFYVDDSKIMLEIIPKAQTGFNRILQIFLFENPISKLFCSIKSTSRYAPLSRFGLVLRTRLQSVASCLCGATRYAPDPSSLARLSMVWPQFKSHLRQTFRSYGYELKAGFSRR